MVKGKTTSRTEKQMQERAQKIRESIRAGYVVEDNVGGVDHVGNIWGENSIFHFD